jgi:hypothetical protein
MCSGCDLYVATALKRLLSTHKRQSDFSKAYMQSESASLEYRMKEFNLPLHNRSRAAPGE